jgi:hypothetical protein
LAFMLLVYFQNLEFSKKYKRWYNYHFEGREKDLGHFQYRRIKQNNT